MQVALASGGCTNRPDQEIVVRDFCYSVYDPRHWGRTLPGQLHRLAGNQGVYRARARFDFDAAADGELDLRENDTLLILANLGNGWLSARKHPAPASEAPGAGGDVAAPSPREKNTTGLVPENYVQRV